MPRQIQPKFGIQFACSKIKKLYSLHIATMCAAFLYSIIVLQQPIGKLFIDLVLHSALVQIWIPYSKYYSTLNGLSWYLCASVFMYFCFSFILKLFINCKKLNI